jgi:hypothetical protein
MNNAVFLDVAPYGHCKIRRLGGMFFFHLQGRRNILEQEELLDVSVRSLTPFLDRVFLLS